MMGSSEKGRSLVCGMCLLRSIGHGADLRCPFLLQAEFGLGLIEFGLGSANRPRAKVRDRELRIDIFELYQGLAGYRFAQGRRQSL